MIDQSEIGSNNQIVFIALFYGRCQALLHPLSNYQPQQIVHKCWVKNHFASILFFLRPILCRSVTDHRWSCYSVVILLQSCWFDFRFQSLRSFSRSKVWYQLVAFTEVQSCRVGLVDFNLWVMKIRFLKRNSGLSVVRFSPVVLSI